MEKALFKSKALACWSWQDVLGMLQVQLQTCSSSETKHYGDGFPEAGNANIPGVKTELQTQVTYFHSCQKEVDLTHKKQGRAYRGYGCRSTFAGTQLERKEPGKDVGAGEVQCEIGSAPQ